MNDKLCVVDLANTLSARGDPVRHALSVERDRYLVHHRGFGGAAFVWLNRPSDLAATAAVAARIEGVEEVLTLEEAVGRYHLAPSRTGDLVVLGDRDTVFGELGSGVESESLPVGYRSHGSRHELQVPLLAYNSEHEYEEAPTHNKDLLAPLLGAWLGA
jgi:phosphonoacetate hydrolase